MTVFASMVPFVGTASVWLPGTLYLLATGAWPKAIILAVWGAAVVSSVDNFLRPQSDITELVTKYAGQSIGSVDVGTLVSSLTAVVYENHLFLPPGVMLLLRMLGELEGPPSSSIRSSACSN